MLVIQNVSRSIVGDVIRYVYGDKGNYSKKTQRQVFEQMHEYNQIIYLLLQIGG